MKCCRTANGLLKSIKNGEHCVMKVWGVDMHLNGANINLGEGKYSIVGEETWTKIKNYIRKPNGEIPDKEFWSY